ncbi:MAG: radical SAM protein [Candidatus Latescibacteria bacterium]|jgi:AdoMet-dependent heme synthase|nr:radical SAM protein [Candidatus Latescibacterota bacterium]
MKDFNLRLLFWETTVGCNLRCAHCRASAEPGRSPAEMSTQQALKFVDDIADFAKPILVLSGGEPLFRPDILDIAAHASSRELQVALATNGTLVDQGMAREIKKAGISRVSISIDGVNNVMHDSFRGVPGAYEAALDGAGYLRREGIGVQFNTTVTQHNIDALPQIVKLAEREKAVALHLFLLVPVGCGLEVAETDQISPEAYEEVLNWFYQTSRETDMEMRATCAPHYYRIIRQRAKEEGRKVTPQSDGMAAMTKGCLAGTGVCFVSYMGDVYPCGYFPVAAGNVLDEPISKIWESAPLFEELRDTDNLEGKCGGCEYRNVCGGCRARAYGMTGNYLGEEPFCVHEPLKIKRSSVSVGV